MEEDNEQEFDNAIMEAEAKMEVEVEEHHQQQQGEEVNVNQNHAGYSSGCHQKINSRDKVDVFVLIKNNKKV